MNDNDPHWMRLALDAAARAVSVAEPNPRVGCVLVGIDGRQIGAGHTQAVGGPHAEIMALRDAQARGHATTGATAYVTLEPCSHQGRTGPCCEALAAAGVRRVVASIADPNPVVAGQGLARLRAAGVEVAVGPGAAESRELNIGFFSRMLRRTPWVRLKVAATLDGKTALENGISQWITSEAARADGHAWRSRADAILTGIGTVLEDNPRLDVRLAPPAPPAVDPSAACAEPAGPVAAGPVIAGPAHAVPVIAGSAHAGAVISDAAMAYPVIPDSLRDPRIAREARHGSAAISQRQPTLVVVDSRLETPLDAALFMPGRRVLIYAAVADAARAQALSDRGATVVNMPGRSAGTAHKVDLRGMLADLAARECNELHVEAGHKLNGSLVREGLVDELLVYLAPKLVGQGRDMANFGPLTALAQALQLEFRSATMLGPDLRIVARVVGRDNF